MRNDIQIIRLKCATIINSSEHFFSYNYKAQGEFNCILNFCPMSYVLDALEASKIVKVKNRFSFQDDNHESCSLILEPQFGYDNQKFEDVVYSLFENFKL
jgi:hypothetical protein